MSENKPNSRSSDSEAMLPYWKLADAMIDGQDAMRGAGERVLPRFPAETDKKYKYRLSNAPYTNIFGDIVESLASKPFAKELGLAEGASQEMLDFIEDVDGRGGHIHVFSATTFQSAIASGIDWILVDKIKVDGATSQADERAVGARPYWVKVAAKDVLAVYSATHNGEEIFTHIRIDEPVLVRDGFGETVKKRVRVFNREQLGDNSYGPATFEVYEEQKVAEDKTEWVVIDSGPISIGIIPMVPILLGARKGNSWRFKPPLADAAYLQLEHFQQEAGIKNNKTMTGFPMLAANGIEKPRDEATGEFMEPTVGPQTTLFTTTDATGSNNGKWEWIEPTATNSKWLTDDRDKIESRIRELGKQPLTAQSGNLTVITTAVAGQKGASAVQAWAFRLKDALENALLITARWLNEKNGPVVEIHTDFAVSMAEDKGPDILLKARAAGDISRLTLLAGFKRRDILDDEFNADDDLIEILKEIPGDDDLLPSNEPAPEPMPEG